MNADSRLIQDDDSHWYLIPWGMEWEFEQWVEREYEDKPEWIVDIDGPGRLIIKDYVVL